MRLLECDTDGEFRLTEIFDNIPPYAILSHTWGPEEITFTEMMERTRTSKAGFDKIQFCAQQARHDGLRYFWVDTCCIDKSNHTELNEAINSMFRWYQQAARCYVYLSDVSIADCERKSKQSELSWETAFRASRWFTRGWTLQELLAPASVEFFTRECQPLGDKRSLEQKIHEITGISVAALRGADLSQFNVEERFKWTEKRQTTREEDRAYCLLGIFGVFMPLIYGEGRENAARRLRQEIDGALNRELHFVLDKLPRADGAAFDSLVEGAAATCHPDTRVDLLRQIHEWTDQHQAEAIFWLNGMAGTGKSTISRTVARHFADSRCLGASFFFKRGDGDRGKVTKFFTTIAAQLVCAVPAMAVHVKNTIESDPAVVGKAMWEQFEKLIFGPLSKICLDGSQTLVMVVDALDECEPDDHVKLIINLFSRAMSLTSLRLRILVTSRPELPIRLGFGTIQGRYHHLVLHEIPEPVIKHDISAYLASELVRIRDEYNYSVPKHRRLDAEWPGNSTIEILVEMAVPLFIFGTTVCRFLTDRRGGNPDKQLGKVLQYQTRSQESKFDAMYLPVLNPLLVSLSNREREEVLERFRVIVGSIVILASPHSSHSLAQMLAISKDTIDDMLDLLHSVLSVPSSSHYPIRLLHLSFRDFLLNPEMRESNPFWIDERQTHMQLAAHCVRIMSEHLRTDICGLQMPGMRRSAINPKIIDDNLPPAVQYACVFWVYHVKQSSLRIRDGDQFHDFLGRHLLHWLEALGLIGRAMEGITIIRSLQSLVEHRNNPALSSFLNDAVRLVLANSSVIDSAPLQLYSSVLAFAPQRSIIRKTFENEVSAWISQWPEAETNWSQCLQILEGHNGKVCSVAFSHDSALVASASLDGTVRIWRTDTGKCLHRLEHSDRGVNSVAFSHDSMLVASGLYNGIIHIWRTKTGECVRTLIGSSYNVISIAFSFHSTLIASASRDNTVRIWLTNTGECKQEVKCDKVDTVAFSHDSILVASASFHGSIRIWRADTGVCVQEFKNFIDGNVNSVTFSHDLAFVAWGSNTIVQIYRTDTGECAQELKGHSNRVQSIAFSHDSAFVASASKDRTIRIWNIEAGECVQELTGESGWVESLTFSHDSMLIASGSYDTMVRIWRTDTGECVKDVKGHSGEVNSVAFSHDFALVASCSRDETVRIWCINTRECIQKFEGHDNVVFSVAFSHDSALVVLGSGGEILIWHTKSGQFMRELNGHEMSVRSVAFSHDSTLVSSGSRDATARIWRTSTGECVQELYGHSRSVEAVAFSHNSTLIASASWDGTVRIWSTNTGACVKILNSHILRAWISVAFSHNSFLVASASEEGTIQIWRIDTSECIQDVDVGVAIHWLSFASDDSLLFTSVGAIGVRKPQASEETLPDTASVTQTDFNAGRDYRSGYGFSRDLTWITWHGQDLLWLPVEFRPVRSAVSASTVLIGCKSGRVIFIRFSTQKLPRGYRSIDTLGLIDDGDVDERRETALQRPDTSVLPRASRKFEKSAFIPHV